MIDFSKNRWFIQNTQKSRQSGSLRAHYFMNQNYPGHAVFTGSSEKVSEIQKSTIDNQYMTSCQISNQSYDGKERLQELECHQEEKTKRKKRRS